MTGKSFLQKFFQSTARMPILLALVYSVILAIFYSPFLSGSQCFYYTDSTFFLEPQAKFLSSVLSEWRLPLWNPLAYCGMPQVAVTFPSLFYVPDWLLVLIPFSQGLAVSMIFHITLAAVGTYLLFKSFGFPKLSALSGAIVFSLSGFVFGLSSNVSLIAGLGWLTIAFWALTGIEHTSGMKRYWCTVRAALFILMLLLSGRPEMIVPSIVALVCYVIWSAIRCNKTKMAYTNNIAIWQTRALLLAAVLSLPALLPVAEWLSQSRRATGLTEGEIFYYSAHWYDLLAMFTGTSLGDLRLHHAVFRSLASAADVPPYLSCAYVGPIAASLALWGLFDSRWNWRWLTLGLLICTFAICLGNTTMLIPNLVHVFPVLAFIRFPIKFLGFVTLLIALLVARGMFCLMTGSVAVKGSYIFWSAVAISGITITMQACLGHVCLTFATEAAAMSMKLQGQYLIGNSIIVTAVCGLATTYLGTLTNSCKISPMLSSIAVIVALSASLLINAFAREHNGAPTDYWTQPSFGASTVKSLQLELHTDPQSRIFNTCFERITPPTSYFGSDKERASVNEFQYHRQILKQNNNMDFAIPETFGFEGTSRGDYYYSALHAYLKSSQAISPEIQIPSDLPLAKFCAITSTNYVLTHKYRTIGRRTPVKNLNPRLFRLAVESEEFNLRIYQVLNSLPKCYITHHWSWTRSHNMILDNLQLPQISRIDPFTCTILESSKGEIEKQCIDRTPLRSASDELRFDTHEANCFSAQAKTTKPGFLVLSDQFYPGWHAYLDSKPAEIYAANGFTRAVELPAGAHTVQFKYEPESLRLGLILAALGFALSIFLYLHVKKQWRAAADF